MKIYEMKDFEYECKKLYVEHYNLSHENKITLGDVFTVWSCKTLQNFKCLISDSTPKSGVYAEYTYNGDKGELYEDIYMKTYNARHK